jgi:hypothetical protein
MAYEHLGPDALIPADAMGENVTTCALLPIRRRSPQGEHLWVRFWVFASAVLLMATLIRS